MNRTKSGRVSNRHTTKTPAISMKLAPWLIAGTLLLSSFGFFACERSGYQDIRDYYFPLKNLTEGLVYEYECLEGGLPPDYRYYRSFINGKEVKLTQTLYNANLIPSVFTREALASNGMQVEDLYILYPDGNGKQIQEIAEVEIPDVFPFEVKEEGGIYLFKVSWSDPSDSTHLTTLIQNRYYVGDTTFTFNRKDYPAVQIQLREGIDDDDEGVLSLEYEGMELYAKGLGLVYYEKEIAPGQWLKYRLSDRYEMSVLEEQFRQMNQ